MKICLACSAGGHLTEVLQLALVYKKYDHFFITFKRKDSEDLSKTERVYFITDPKRNIIKLLKNIKESITILLREKPDVIITTGAGVVIPTCYIAKILGKKIIFIESFCRIFEKSFTGRLIYPIAGLFLIQWKELSGKYGRKAIHAGPVF